MRIIVQKPKDVEPELIKTFRDLVYLHSKIDLEGLYDRISMAALLSFAIKDDVILAIRAIKKPDPRYVQEVFTNAGIADLHNQFSHETGWSVTLPEHRCKGLSGTLLKELITKIDANVYSTTRVSNKAPQKILERTGFVQTGKEFSGREESLILWLYEPEQNWEEEIYEKEGCLGI